MMRIRNQRRSTRHDGFLLTETLATFTLSAFVLLGMVMGASMLVRAVDRSAAKVQAADDLDRALAALGRDITGIVRARWAGEEPQPFVFRGGPDSLLFVGDERGPGGAITRRVVSLREIVLNGVPTLTRSDAPLPADAHSFADLRFGAARPFPTGPARLRFAYAPAARAGVPVPARLASWPSGPTLPAAVIVEALDAASGRLLVSERFPVRADADIGCLVSRGTRSGGAGTAGQETGGGGPGGFTSGGGLAGANGGVAAPGGGSGLDGLAGLTPPQNGGQNPGIAAGGALGSAASPAHQPEPDFCGRADKDDKMDGSGPRAGRQAALP